MNRNFLLPEIVTIYPPSGKTMVIFDLSTGKVIAKTPHTTEVVIALFDN